MIVRYSVIEDWLVEEGIWFPWGVLYENPRDDPTDDTLLIRAIPDDDRRKGRYFDHRIREVCPSIEDADVVLGKYVDRYRVRPEIRTVEGEGHREIRKRLWNVIFEEMEERRAEPRAEYTPQGPASHALREGSEEEE